LPLIPSISPALWGKRRCALSLEERLACSVVGLGQLLLDRGEADTDLDQALPLGWINAQEWAANTASTEMIFVD